jgi:predicted metal-dependent phosphotriesterase family hydrolase
MRARGFTDAELDLMFKENPAKALGLGLAATTIPLGP